MFGVVVLLDLYTWTGDRESISGFLNHDSMFLWMISLALTERRDQSPYRSIATGLNVVSVVLLLWIDCAAAALAGVTVLMLSGWLSSLSALPRGLLLFMGAVNMLYASYSFALATRSRRPRLLINLLVFANLAWSVVCLGLALAFAGSVTSFGLGHLVGEAVFVGGLAGLEWRWRNQLLTVTPVPA